MCREEKVIVFVGKGRGIAIGASYKRKGVRTITACLTTPWGERQMAEAPAKREEKKTRILS